jgi:hypothetical protein
VAELFLVKSMSTRSAKISDVRGVSAGALLLLVRLGLALVFADTLAVLVFRASFMPQRLLIGFMVLLGATVMAGWLLRHFEFVPVVLWNSVCLGAVVFLAMAWRYHDLQVPARSPLLEYSTIGLCVAMFTITLLVQRRRKRRT